MSHSSRQLITGSHHAPAGLCVATGTSAGLRRNRLLCTVLLCVASASAVPPAATAATAAAAPANYSALCVIARDENAYVEEWVSYHRCLGFSQIYLYDHNSSVPLSGAVAGAIAEGFVTYIPWGGGVHTRWARNATQLGPDLDHFNWTAQGRAYKHCLAHYSSRHRFIGFLDVDEFLVFHDKTLRSVNDLLRRYEQNGSLSVFWIQLGSSGHQARPRGGGVVDSYSRCIPAGDKANTQFKTFVNTAFLPYMYSPHRAKFHVEGALAVDEDHGLILRGRQPRGRHRLAAVYHYATKSLQEFRVKAQRGGGAGVTRLFSYFRDMKAASTAKCTAAVDTRKRLCARAGKGGRAP